MDKPAFSKEILSEIISELTELTFVNCGQSRSIAIERARIISAKFSLFI